MNNGEIFWNTIFNAKKFVKDISDRLNEYKNVVLLSSDEIPWYDYFYKNIEYVMDNNTCGKYNPVPIKESKEQYLFENIEDISKYLLHHDDTFFDDPIRKSTEAREVESRENEFVKFFAKNVFLYDKNNDDFYIWLELYSEKSFVNWVNFVSDYMVEKDKNDKNIVFVISYHNNFNVENTIIEENKDGKMEEFKDKIQSNFASFLLKDYNISWYDCYVFFTTVISNSEYIKINDYFKLYLAELLTNIVRDNITGKIVELCVECLNDYTNFIEKPNKKIKSIFSECNIGKDINETIYRSQIRVFYPMLNEFRLYFINKYKEILNDIINNDKQFIVDMYKNDKNLTFTLASDNKLLVCMDANDKIKQHFQPKHFELGKLKYLEIYNKKIKYNEDYDDSDDLSKYVDARNDLSHKGFLNSYVDFSLLKKIINIFEKKVR